MNYVKDQGVQRKNQNNLKSRQQNVSLMESVSRKKSNNSKKNSKNNEYRQVCLSKKTMFKIIINLKSNLENLKLNFFLY